MNDILPQKHVDCPNCGSNWCPQEIAEQECFKCGYPEPYDPEIDDETED